MAAFQAWLVTTLASVKVVSPFMNSTWGWPICETVHFFGLSLLIGTIGMFDLRLLGLAKRVPIGALHRLVPWGIFGFVLNVITGAMFLVTEPQEYIYNPAFHFKMLLLALAGLNIQAFYLTVFRKVEASGSGHDAPRSAKVIASASLFLWLGVMVLGRLLTFTRPGFCGIEPVGFLSTGLLSSCIPGLSGEAAPATNASGATPRFNASAWSLPDDGLLGFTEISAGRFTMGSDESRDNQALDDELPQHPVALPTFFMGRYEVTVGQYKVCVNDGVCRPGDRNALSGRDDLPVRYVSWHEAVAYCGWLELKLKSWSGAPRRLADALAGRRDGRAWHVTLPSEAEWEKAARGVDGRIYPWGEGIDPTKANYTAAKRGGPTPVGAFPGGASPYQLLDISGNVSEWTRSHFEPYPYRSDDGRENLKAGDAVPRVVRGGSFQNAEGNVRATSRFRADPTNRSNFIGFRVVASRF